MAAQETKESQDRAQLVEEAFSQVTVLSRDQLRAALQARPVEFEDVDASELGKGIKLRIREMQGSERDNYEASVYNGKNYNLINVRARLVLICLVNPDMTQMYKPSELGEVGAMPAKLLDRLFKAAQRVNKISDEDIDELTKN